MTDFTCLRDLSAEIERLLKERDAIIEKQLAQLQKIADEHERRRLEREDCLGEAT